jgi:glycosyltransferase involved in cell wall biosynthesis
MRILTFSTLFPNAALPQHGIFVAERLRHLLASGSVDATVVAPVPWFPTASSLFPEYSKWSTVPREEEFEGVRVLHPRYPVIPKIGMTVAPVLLALWSLQTMRKVMAEGTDIDVIDAHYLYPDGVAAALLGRWLDKPLTITGRGTDLNLIPQYRLPRSQIRWAAGRAAQLATVSESLRSVLTGLGVPEYKTRTLRNGVDLEIFTPLAQRDQLRADAGVNGTSLLTVGHLIERKGHHLAIEALARLPGNVELRIAGDGPMEAQLRQTALDNGVADRVHFLGRLDRPDLVKAYNVADILVLASSREGMANVLLESMSCGTPVVATNVWGAPEVVTENSGELVSARRPGALVDCVISLLERDISRVGVRRHAEAFSWQATTQGQLDMFESALQRRHGE